MREISLYENRTKLMLWSEGLYSIVAFELQPRGSGLHLTMTHEGFPEGMRAHLNGEMPEAAGIDNTETPSRSI